MTAVLIFAAFCSGTILGFFVSGMIFVARRADECARAVPPARRFLVRRANSGSTEHPRTLFAEVRDDRVR